MQLYHLKQFPVLSPPLTLAHQQLLCGASLPRWINRLARVASALPFVESMLPPHWVRPILPDGHSSSFDVDGEPAVDETAAAAPAATDVSSADTMTTPHHQSVTDDDGSSKYAVPNGVANGAIPVATVPVFHVASSAPSDRKDISS